MTKPYSPRQWQDILARGAAVDVALAKGDVRLTMGGEPTFVSATDMEAAEWNIDAMGPTKRVYAGRLIRKLTDLGAGALCNIPWASITPASNCPAGRCMRIGGRMASRSGATRRCSPPMTTRTAPMPKPPPPSPPLWRNGCKSTRQWSTRPMRNVHYYLWREKRLPANVVAEDAKLRDVLERERLSKVFGQGLASPVGSVLPLRRVEEEGARRWQSSKWFFRDSVMFLVPGDSPIGLRLPLESLPWADPEHVEIDAEVDPFAPREKLPPREHFQRTREGVVTSGIESFAAVPQDAPAVGKEEPGLVRTALAVEARDGILRVFYPPLYAAEDWLEPDRRR